MASSVPSVPKKALSDAELDAVSAVFPAWRQAAKATELPTVELLERAVRTYTLRHLPPPKSPAESDVLRLACQWLTTVGEDLVDAGRIHEIEVLLDDNNLTLAWQRLMPLLEERHGTRISFH